MISTQINNSLTVAKGQASVSREQTIVNKGKMFETHLHFPTLFFVAKSVQVAYNQLHYKYVSCNMKEIVDPK